MRLVNKFMFFFLLFLLLQPSLRSQNLRRVYVDSAERVVQLLMLNEHQAIALAKGTGKLKLVNTLLLIEDGIAIDSLVQKGSLDFVRIVNDTHLKVFCPTASLVNVYIENGMLVLGKTEKIQYDKVIWSTNFEEAVLTAYNGITIAFNQGSEEFSLDPRDPNSTPLFKLYFDSKITDLNSPNQKAVYNHWPSYIHGVMPPMNLVRVIQDDIFIILSNLGEYYRINTKTKSIDKLNFPDKSGVISWSLFYDRVKENYYYVSYNIDNSFDFFSKDNNREAINEESIKDFADVIINDQLLIKRKVKNGHSYLLKSLNN
jgi:hypothetical protein